MIKPIDDKEYTLIKRKFKIGQKVISDNVAYIISNLLDDQKAVYERKLRGDKEIKNKLGYRKSEATVSLIHNGKILVRTNKYVGLNYDYS